MNDKTEDQVRAAQAALMKMGEALQEWLDAIADPGEPEVAENAVLLFEAKGMAEHGIFYRRQYLLVERTGSVSGLLGMIDLVGEELDHDLRCGGREEHE